MAIKKILTALLLMSSFVFPQARWLSEDKLVGWNFTSGWTIVTGTIDDNNSFTTTGGGGVSKAIGLVAGKVYKLVIAGSTSSSGISVRQTGTANIYGTGFGTHIFTALSGDNGIYIRNGGAGITDITTLTIQEVLLSSPIAKSKTNFVQPIPTSLVNEPNCVFAYLGNQPISKTIIDASGNGNNGTLNGGTMYAGGLEGGLQFNGTSSYVSVADANSLDFGTSDFSMEINFSYKSASQSIAGIISKNYLGSGGIAVYFASGQLRVAPESGSTFTFTKSFSNDIFYNISLVRSGDNALLYVNGILEQTITNAFATYSFTNASALLIGVRNTPTTTIIGTIYSAKLYNVALTSQQVKDKWNKIANKPYIIEDFSDGTVGKFPRDWTKISGTHVIASGTPKYLNCTSAGSIFFTTRDNASNCYMTYDYYTAGAWTSKAGLVSALSTAEATLDYNATNRKLTFIMATNDRVRNIKITRGQPVQ